ncbi:MAG TPA: hypothetical protein VNH44_17830 [Micropepsaceae bacterium]|nr:hypothetical protein [Micropepsaceae bacterium]
MTRILIVPYAALEETVRRHRPSHLVTLMVEPFVETPAAILAGRHLRLGVHDIIEPSEGAVAPDSSHIADMLAFARDWDRTAPFLVHCWAGISRSTAAAYILLCNLHEPGHEMRIAHALRFRAPHAQPNRLMIHHADQLLSRGGRMVAAVEAIGEGRPSLQGEVVELPLDLDEL